MTIFDGTFTDCLVYNYTDTFYTEGIHHGLDTSSNILDN